MTSKTKKPKGKIQKKMIPEGQKTHTKKGNKNKTESSLAKFYRS